MGNPAKTQRACTPKVPVYIERFVLPILAGIILLLVVQNLFKLKSDQRAALFLAVATSAYLIATLVHPTERFDSSTAQSPDERSAQEEKVDKPKEPPQGPIASAPYGIAIGGGTVTNPTVNNFVVPRLQRQITDAQAVRLVEVLRPLAGPKVSILLSQANNESSQFGMRLAQVLKSAGIEVVKIDPVMSFHGPGPIPAIAFVVDRTAKGQEPLALTLGNTLVALGIVNGPFGVNPPESAGNPEFLIIDIYPLG